ncbi:MAG: phenylacetate-CoA oxygenase subunit PaaI [Pyrinomonadaceae bacterium]|nr:phenylacetate-CoA oxygenase subunit PaaI [Pyrinomonadaceae bacterium]
MPRNYDITTIRPKYHNAIVEWQQQNFADMKMLEKYWDKYFPKQTPFQLISKVGTLKTEDIEHGRYKGQKRFEKASELKGNMFYSARDLIKAQCSTELGSIQQHRDTLDRATSDEAKFAILRIMAEELRHAYQMFWVLDNDPTWKKTGHSDIAAETIEELLSMSLGSHVLDAFNIEFNDFLDNITYATLIDLVGKYQLDMQKAFSYAPVARSMGPMFSEEGFHLGAGRKHLKEIAVNATEGRGDYSIKDVQRALNQWYPRGLEMFGNELGGETNVNYGFKDKTNGVAQGEYINEVQDIVNSVNVGIAEVFNKGTNRHELLKMVNHVQETRERKFDMSPEHFVTLPSNKFNRKRGPYMFQPYSIYGEMLTAGTGRVAAQLYENYLRENLPEKYVADSEFTKYMEQMHGFYAKQEASASSDDPFASAAQPKEHSW